MSKGTHDYAPDARNAAIKINLNGQLVARDAAKVSVFDAGYVLGDGVWEGLRVHDGGLPFLDLHLDRLYEGAKAIDLDIGLAIASSAFATAASSVSPAEKQPGKSGTITP